MVIRKDVKEFGMVVFVLLGVLFGMIIMVFIFGSLGDANDKSLDKVTSGVGNETGNITSGGYTLVGTTLFTGFTNPIIVTATNASSGVVISASDISLTNAGLIVNATAFEWFSANITYTYQHDGNAASIGKAVTNNSLEAIETYSEQADTQFNTTAIAITLLILLAVFAFFWKFFMGTGGGRSRGSGGNPAKTGNFA